jgi:phosphoglycolate phosphatase-like HAD superfamily hydrolase
MIKNFVLLWDIDGTLVSSRSPRADKHLQATEKFLGRKRDKLAHTLGKTDLQIVSELLRGDDSHPIERDLLEVLGILDALTLAEIDNLPLVSTPGALEALQTMSELGLINGILTGNTPIRAQKKLESAGLWGAIDKKFTFFGNTSKSRFELVKSSLSQISNKCDYEIITIGDTPLDIQSAHANGLQTVAVATGDFSSMELVDSNPELLIDDLESGLTDLIEFLSTLPQ